MGGDSGGIGNRLNTVLGRSTAPGGHRQLIDQEGKATRQNGEDKLIAGRPPLDHALADCASSKMTDTGLAQTQQKGDRQRRKCRLP